MFPEMDDPPEGVDPGQWALEQYRKWRVVYMNGSRVQPVGVMNKPPVRAHEEPPG